MRAVILAAGEGTRMRPLTENRPKVMLPIANKPMLEYTLLAARDAGIKDILLIVGYRKESIIGYFGDGSRWGLNIEYVTQERQQGTGHAFGMAAGHCDDDGRDSGRFIAMNGDITVSTAHLKKLKKRKEDAIISVKQVPDPTAFGVIETNGGLVTRIVEKSPQPPTNMANAGVYVFSPCIFEAIGKTPLSPRGEIEVTDSLQMLIDSGKSVGYEVMGEDWMDIGRPWDLLTANELMVRATKPSVEGEVEPNATLKGPVSVGKGTVVRNGAYIVGPVIIGENCDIGPNCYIRAHTSIGDNVHVGNAVEIKELHPDERHEDRPPELCRRQRDRRAVQLRRRDQDR